MDSSQSGTDVFAVNEGFVSVTPIMLDWTDHRHLEELEACLLRVGG